MIAIQNAVDGLAPDISWLTNTLSALDQAMSGVPTDIGWLTNAVAGLETSLATVPGDVADLTNAIATLDFSSLTNAASLATTVNDINSAVSVINWDDITSMMTSLQNIEDSNLNDFNFAALDEISTIVSSLSGLDTLLGSATDSAGADTFFGRLNSIADDLGTVSSGLGGIAGSSAAAARNSQTAKTQTLNLVNTVTAMEDAVAKGDLAGMKTSVASLREQMAALIGSIQGIRDGNFAEMQREMNQTSDLVAKIWDLLVKQNPELAGEPGDADGTGGTGEEEKVLDTVKDMHQSLADMKAEIELLKLLIDQVANPTTVSVEWFE